MKQKIAKKEENDVEVKDDNLEKISLENNLKKDKETKQIPPEALKDIFRNIIIAIGVIIYFAILNFTYFKIEQENILSVIEICSGVLLLVALILLEIAYKKDSGKFTISAIEFLVLAFHSLSIKYVITRYDYQLQFYLLTSSYVISIYFILKAIVIYTKGRKKYLDTLSDIPEILKKDEPVKKEAKKRNEIVEKPKTEKKMTAEHKPKSKRGTKRKKVESEKEIKDSKTKIKKEDSKTDKNTETKNTSRTTKKLKEENLDDVVNKRKTTTKKTKKADAKINKEKNEDKEKLEVKNEEKKKNVKTKKKTSKKEE